MRRPPTGIFPFGKKDCTTAAVISGGSASSVREAIESKDIDLFVTGESSHSVYHECLEGKINMIAGGHYNTEVWGVQAVIRHCMAETGIECEFVDVPTGL
jgi:putative NIF3 family GTP cyclohydrolase 1 type 2